MTKRPEKRDIKAYKFMEPNGQWAIILAVDEHTARECYLENFNVSEKYLKKIKIRTMNPQKRVKFAMNGKLVPLSSLINDVKFPPRCVLDSSDYFGDIS